MKELDIKQCTNTDMSKLFKDHLERNSDCMNYLEICM